jgi:hypothetical protein
LVVVGGNLSGVFDAFGSVVPDSFGFSEFTGVFSSAAALPNNHWYLQYAQNVLDATGALTGQAPGTYDVIFFHYRVTGFVPEPESFTLLVGSLLAFRTARTLRERRRRLTLDGPR